jgi:tetratricopeptide (TPR) repeat protein
MAPALDRAPEYGDVPLDHHWFIFSQPENCSIGKEVSGSVSNFPPATQSRGLLSRDRYTSVMRSSHLIVGLGVVLLAASCPVFAHPGPHVRIEALTDSLAREPGGVKWWVERAEQYLEYGDHAAALRDLDYAEALAPGLAEISQVRGAILLTLGDAAGAEKQLTRAIEHDPSGADAYLLRGRARMALGRPLAAAPDFEHSVQFSARPTPDHFLAWSRALAAPGVDRPIDALAVLNRGMALLGSSFALAEESVKLECARGAWDEALGCIERHAAAWGSGAATRARRGDVLRAAGREIEAEVEYTTALAELEALARTRAAAPASLESRLRAALRQAMPGARPR